MANIRIRTGEIQVGDVLVWPVFDQSGKLLLREGNVINSEHQLAVLLERGLYRAADPAANTAADEELEPAPEDPFVLFEDFGQQLDRAFRHLENGESDTGARILAIADDIQSLCSLDADAALATVHLCHEPRYTLCHPLHVAILCNLIGTRLGMMPEQLRPLLAAALSQNCAVIALQDNLQNQSEPLTPDQERAIKEHPERAVEMLQRAGVADESWLRCVLQHHERLDGSGYPKGLTGDSLNLPVMLLGLTDSYCAMVSGRTYRQSVPAKDALRTFFTSRGQQFDDTLCLVCVKELSVYPPGLFCKLANGESGVVVKRAPEGSLHPTIAVYKTQRGELYSHPFRRSTSDTRYAIAESLPTEIHPRITARWLWGFA